MRFSIEFEGTTPEQIERGALAALEILSRPASRPSDTGQP